MKLSRYFLPTLREDPADAQVLSHKLMLRSGMIHPTCHGIYSWLPLGLKVLAKLERIIADEQDKAGCHRILMPTIQPATLWRDSGRYDDYGKEMLRIKDRHGRDMLYSPTHEEVATDIMRQFLKSYKQMPLNVYQIGWKFRDEIRPRFGVMRGREFLMKDGYSFDVTKDAAVAAYKKVVISYLKTFERMGLKAIPIRADSGAIGGDLSHEFHVVADTGESEIFYDCEYDALSANTMSFDDIERIYSAADDKHDPANCQIPTEKLRTARGIEVGHVFYFGTKYSKAMGLSVVGRDGEAIFPEMGSYGIGVSRLVAAIIEANHDKNGIVWPASVAPFKFGIITASWQDPSIVDIAEDLYQKMITRNVEVVYDDREERAGVKFADMDLIGIPFQIVLGAKCNDGIFEWKDRRTGERMDLTLEALFNKVDENDDCKNFVKR
ncbi:MAG: proline--tRNA ligase [Holosporales bacterium]|jgi:prolyl-tRNA synthetase|nr:proline--tRNA ligase [Holosporales bacterium]